MLVLLQLYQLRTYSGVRESCIAVPTICQKLQWIEMSGIGRLIIIHFLSLNPRVYSVYHSVLKTPPCLKNGNVTQEGQYNPVIGRLWKSASGSTWMLKYESESPFTSPVVLLKNDGKMRLYIDRSSYCTVCATRCDQCSQHLLTPDGEVCWRPASEWGSRVLRLPNGLFRDPGRTENEAHEGITSSEGLWFKSVTVTSLSCKQRE